MNMDREIVVAKWVTFDPGLVHISVKRREIELEILPQTAFSLQPQHMLQSSAYLNVIGLRSIFE